MDFVVYVDTRTYTSKYIFLLLGGVVFWRGDNQTIIVLSVVEAKVIGCYEATTHVLWLRNFIKDLRVVETIEKLLKIFFLEISLMEAGGKKHIYIKYLIVRDHIKKRKRKRGRENEMVIEHINTLLITDPITKGLSNVIY